MKSNHLSDAQREALEELYQQNAYPSPEDKARLATELGISSTSAVSNWFRSRRKKAHSGLPVQQSHPSVGLTHLQAASLDSAEKALEACAQLSAEHEASVNHARSLQHGHAGSQHLPEPMVGSSGDKLRSCVAVIIEGSSLPLSQLVSFCTQRLRSAGASPTDIAVRNAINMVARREPLVGKGVVSDNVDPYEDDSSEYAWCWHVHDEHFFPSEAWPTVKEFRGWLDRCRIRLKAINAAHDKLQQAANSFDGTADGLLGSLLSLAHAEPVVAGFWHLKADELPAGASKSEKATVNETVQASKNVSKSIREATQQKERQQKGDERARRQAERHRKDAEQERKIAMQQVCFLHRMPDKSRRHEALTYAQSPNVSLPVCSYSWLQNVMKNFFVPINKVRKESKDSSGQQDDIIGDGRPSDAGSARCNGFTHQTSTPSEQAPKRHTCADAEPPSVSKQHDQRANSVLDIISPLSGDFSRKELLQKVLQWARNHPPRRTQFRWQRIHGSNQLADPFKLRRDNGESPANCTFANSLPNAALRTPPKQQQPGVDLIPAMSDGSNAQLQTVRAAQQLTFHIPFKRKLLQIPFDEEQRAYARPAFWGSWPNTRPHKVAERVNGRRPFATEANLDYEDESADEWEEEEGDIVDKDDDDKEEEEQEGADGDDEGFMVPDGYLSDDERGNKGDADEIAAEQQEQPGSGVEAAAAGEVQPDKRLLELEHLITAARAAKQPLLISSLPVEGVEGSALKHNELLHCLSPRRSQCCNADRDSTIMPIAPTALSAQHIRPQKQKRRTLSETLSMKLQEFVREYSDNCAKADTLVKDFIDKHKDCGEKMSFNAVRNELSAVCQFANGSWTVRKEGIKRDIHRGWSNETDHADVLMAEPARKKQATGSNRKISDFTPTTDEQRAHTPGGVEGSEAAHLQMTIEDKSGEY